MHRYYTFSDEVAALTGTLKKVGTGSPTVEMGTHALYRATSIQSTEWRTYLAYDTSILRKSARIWITTLTLKTGVVTKGGGMGPFTISVRCDNDVLGASLDAGDWMAVTTEVLQIVDPVANTVYYIDIPMPSPNGHMDIAVIGETVPSFGQSYMVEIDLAVGQLDVEQWAHYPSVCQFVGG